MKNKTITKNISLQTNAFQQRLNAIAWPVKCHWAKHFPIEVTVNEEVGVAAMDYERILVHPKLAQFSEAVIFTVLAHEWAHRMASPKSIEANKRIVEAVSQDLNIDLEQAMLVSNPAIELIVDRTNCEVDSWSDVYKEGFTDSFQFFLKEFENNQSNSSDIDDVLNFSQMHFALRLTNVCSEKLPFYIQHQEAQARKLIEILFEDWNGFSDKDDSDHLGKIIRFSRAYYEWIPKELLEQSASLQSLVDQLDNLMTKLIADSSQRALGKSCSSSGNKALNKQNEKAVFDSKLSRQVTDHLLSLAHKPRQITGLWQIGHSFSKLDLKRSTRCSPTLIPGVTTRRKTDSNRIEHFE